MTEHQRITQEYGARDTDEQLRARYRFTNPGHLFLLQQRERCLLALLGRLGVADHLGDLRALDVGCGTGGLLLDLIRYGAREEQVAGVDLVPRRVAKARRRLPRADLREGDAAGLPYPDGAFDLVFQMTVVSTVLDPACRAAIAREMCRVLRPGGAIIWYDLCVGSPGNHGVRPIGRAELRALFPGASVEATRVTLMPPLARLATRRSWLLAELLSALPFLRTHLLAAIRPGPPA